MILTGFWISFLFQGTESLPLIAFYLFNLLGHRWTLDHCCRFHGYGS
jgi:hypothetical protein